MYSTTAWRQSSCCRASARVDPSGRARDEKADCDSRRQLEPADRAALLRSGRFDVRGRNGGAKPLDRRLREQRVKGCNKLIAIPPKRRKAIAKGLVPRQPFEQRGFLLAVELIVDQCGEPLLVVGHRYLVRSYFSFASAVRAAASRLMIVPIGTPSAAAASA